MLLGSTWAPGQPSEPRIHHPQGLCARPEGVSWGEVPLHLQMSWLSRVTPRQHTHTLFPSWENRLQTPSQEGLVWDLELLGAQLDVQHWLSLWGRAECGAVALGGSVNMRVCSSRAEDLAWWPLGLPGLCVLVGFQAREREDGSLCTCARSWLLVSAIDPSKQTAALAQDLSRPPSGDSGCA